MAEALRPGKRVTMGGDMAYDTREFVGEPTRDEHHSARGAEHDESQVERGRRADHAACGV